MHDVMMALGAFELLCFVAALAVADYEKKGWYALGLVVGTVLAILTFVAFA